MKKHLVIGILCLCLAIAPAFTAPQSRANPDPGPQELSLDRKIPVDPDITTGELDNGLRYYIRVNRQPEKRAELRLVVNAGSLQEEEDQRGLAHFIEHMAFNGTTHFAKQELVEFMESLGMGFGPDLNAYTSFDETVFMLRIPTDDKEVLDKAFTVLEDWACGIAFDDEEIEKERGVVIEEWRLGRGAEARMRDRQFPILFQGSRYAERLPIGHREIIESFPPEALRRFYRDWYRPDLMAVIAVGDFESERIESLIRSRFSPLTNPMASKPRRSYPVPDHRETLFAIATDEEATSSSVAVYHKLPVQDESRVGDYRRLILERLFSGMINLRFEELSRKTSAPFLAAVADKGRLIRTRDVFTLSALVREGGIEDGLRALYTEVERIKRFGFTAPELEREKADALRSMEQAYTERDKHDSGLFADEYIRNFLTGEPIPGIPFEFELHQRLLPGITLEEVNGLVEEWMHTPSRVVLVNAPAKEGLPIPDEETLGAIMSSVEDLELSPYVDSLADLPLLSEIPERRGEVVGESSRIDLGITEWRLSNGVRVVFKPTDFKKDEILFRALSPGGTSLVEDSEYIPALTATQVVSAGGLGAFNAMDLGKKLAGTVASVQPVITELEEGLAGRASPRDLETLFQLIYLTFTEPREDKEMFEVIRTQLRSLLENRRQSPEYVFTETFQKTMAGDNPRGKPLTLDDLEKMDLQKSLAFYRDRFADAGDFTFIFVGTINPEALKPLVERYLGALPAAGRKEMWRDLGTTYPRGVIKRNVSKGVEPKSLTAIAFTGPFQYDRENRNAMRAVTSILRTRLRKLIREDLSGTYGVNVRSSFSRIPDEEYIVTINFGSEPGRMEELTGSVFKEIELLKTLGPTVDEMKDELEAERRAYETNRKENGWWMGRITEIYRYGDDPENLLTYEADLDLLTSQAVRTAARRYFNSENFVQVTLMPEKD